MWPLPRFYLLALQHARRGNLPFFYNLMAPDGSRHVYLAVFHDLHPADVVFLADEDVDAGDRVGVTLQIAQDELPWVLDEAF